MSEHDKRPSTDQQTPHSGVRHGERPVRDFDKTSLEDAVNQGLVSTPEDTSLLENKTARNQDKKMSHMKRNLVIGGATVAATLAVSAGAFLGVLKPKFDDAIEQDRALRDDVASAPANTGNELEGDTGTNIEEIDPTLAYLPYAEKVGDTQAMFDNYMSPLINARVNEDRIKSNDYSEFNGITANQNVESLNSFVYSNASQLSGLRQELKESGFSDTLEFGLQSDIVPNSKVPIDGGGFRVTTNLNKWTIDSEGAPSSAPIDTDTYIITFEPKSVLIDGKPVDVHAVTNIDEVVDQASN